MRCLAGGTDVLVQMRSGMVQPDDLIDWEAIPGVNETVWTDDGGWRNGAAVTGSRRGLCGQPTA